MRGIILAWLIGESIIIYRSVTKNHAPPVPGALVAPTGLFLLLGLIAEYDPARFAATALAFGVDIAAFMNLFGLGGGSEQKTSSGPQSKVPPPVPEGNAG